MEFKRIVIFCVIMLCAGNFTALAQDDTDAKMNWKKEVSIGYSRVTGNTKNSQFNAGFDAERKTDYDQLTVKATTLYSSQNKKMDGQKHYGSVRYGFDFLAENVYGFLKFEAAHDRFAKIDSRIIPTAGMGYWFSDTEDWKALAEIGLGFEHTEYNDGTKEKTDTILVPRVFLEKSVFDNSKISQDLVMFPNLEESDEYRFRSETKFTSPLSETVSLRFSFVDEYNSNPAAGAKKNDTQTLLSVVCSL